MILRNHEKQFKSSSSFDKFTPIQLDTEVQRVKQFNPCMNILRVCTNGTILETPPTPTDYHNPHRKSTSWKTWNFQPKNQHTLSYTRTRNNRVTRRLADTVHSDVVGGTNNLARNETTMLHSSSTLLTPELGTVLPCGDIQTTGRRRVCSSSSQCILGNNATPVP